MRLLIGASIAGIVVSGLIAATQMAPTPNRTLASVQPPSLQRINEIMRSDGADWSSATTEEKAAVVIGWSEIIQRAAGERAEPASVRGFQLDMIACLDAAARRAPNSPTADLGAACAESSPVVAEQACERDRAARDVELYERARPVVLADALRYAQGASVELLEATISAEFPAVMCGAVYFEAHGGMWRFVYENGRVHGRWRDLVAPQSLIEAYCRAPARSCWLVHD